MLRRHHDNFRRFSSNLKHELWNGDSMLSNFYGRCDNPHTLQIERIQVQSPDHENCLCSCGPVLCGSVRKALGFVIEIPFLQDQEFCEHYDRLYSLDLSEILLATEFHARSG